LMIVSSPPLLPGREFFGSLSSVPRPPCWGSYRAGLLSRNPFPLCTSPLAAFLFPDTRARRTGLCLPFFSALFFSQPPFFSWAGFFSFWPPFSRPPSTSLDLYLSCIFPFPLLFHLQLEGVPRPSNEFGPVLPVLVTIPFPTYLPFFPSLIAGCELSPQVFFEKPFFFLAHSVNRYRPFLRLTVVSPPFSCRGVRSALRVRLCTGVQCLQWLLPPLPLSRV